MKPTEIYLSRSAQHLYWRMDSRPSSGSESNRRRRQPSAEDCQRQRQIADLLRNAKLNQQLAQVNGNKNSKAAQQLAAKADG
jgi:hypothetical protein